ncbi:MAG: hypothetical protein K0S65_1450 [Labilithrix sp.]|nr:hypothetical protein [Labilithrix sp.]
MRRYLPAFILALAIAPFPLAGCDLINKLKGGGEDAGADAALEAAVVEDAAPAVEPAPTVDAAPAPTTTLAPTPTINRPVVTDAGVKDAAVAVDAGPAPVDAGPAPAPTPTLKFPIFDGGLFRFDAGGLRLPKTK